MTGPCRRRRRLALALLAMAAACGGEPPPAPFAPFAIRGHLDAPHLTWRVDASGAPIAAEAFTAAVAAAAATWNATGVVQLARAGDGDPAELVLSFRRGHHGACEPFGASTAVAHTGPVGRDSFVHFDAARPWTAATLQRTALHELGHALGLGHSPCADAVMTTGNAVPDQLGPADRDGLHSLYGGGAIDDGDLLVAPADGGPPLVLHGIVGPTTAYAGFDIDGDGRDELLVWCTDDRALGALALYRFAPGPRLAATAGPFAGVTTPGMQVAFAALPDGERVFVGTLTNGRHALLAFDARGTLVPYAGSTPAAAVAAAAREQRRGDDRVDLDGDGRHEQLRRARQQ